jgi:hypothetical protein
VSRSVLPYLDPPAEGLDLDLRATAPRGKLQGLPRSVLALPLRLRTEIVVDLAAEGLDVEVGRRTRLDVERDVAGDVGCAEGRINGSAE